MANDLITEKAGRFVAGHRNTGVGTVLELLPQRAEMLGLVCRQQAKQALRGNLLAFGFIDVGSFVIAVGIAGIDLNQVMN